MAASRAYGPTGTKTDNSTRRAAIVRGWKMAPGPNWHKTGHMEERGEYRLGRKIGVWEYGSESGSSHRQQDHGMPVADLLPKS